MPPRPTKGNVARRRAAAAGRRALDPSTGARRRAGKRAVGVPTAWYTPEQSDDHALLVAAPGVDTSLAEGLEPQKNGPGMYAHTGTCARDDWSTPKEPRILTGGHLGECGGLALNELAACWPMTDDHTSCTARARMCTWAQRWPRSIAACRPALAESGAYSVPGRTLLELAQCGAGKRGWDRREECVPRHAHGPSLACDRSSTSSRQAPAPTSSARPRRPPVDRRRRQKQLRPGGARLAEKRVHICYPVCTSPASR